MLKSALTVALVAGTAASFAAAAEAPVESINNPREAEGRIPQHIARALTKDKARFQVHYINVVTGERYQLSAEQAASLFPAAGSFPGGASVLHGDIDPCNVVAEIDDPATTATDETDALDVGNYALFVADNPDGDGNGLSDLFGDDPVLGDGASPPGDPRFFESFFVHQDDQFYDCMFVQYFTNGVNDLDTDMDGTADAVAGMDLTISFHGGFLDGVGTSATTPYLVSLADVPGSPGFDGTPLGDIVFQALILDFSADGGFELGDTDSVGANGTANFAAGDGTFNNDAAITAFEGVNYSVTSYTLDLTQGTNVAHAWGNFLGWAYGDAEGIDVSDPADGIIDSWVFSDNLLDPMAPNSVEDAIPPADRKPVLYNSVFGIFNGPGTDLSDFNALREAGYFVVGGGALLCDDPATTATDETAPGGDVTMELYAPFTPPPCDADLAAPFGQLDIFDVLAYLAQFDASDPAADLAAPMGSFDIFDVLAYLALFDAGCSDGVDTNVDSSPFSRMSTDVFTF